MKLTQEQIVWNWLTDTQHQMCFELKRLKDDNTEPHGARWARDREQDIKMICKLLGERKAYQRTLVKLYGVNNDTIQNTLDEIFKKYL